MGKKVKILIVGRNQEISNVLLRLVNSNPEWQGFLAMSNHSAKEIFKQEEIQLVLFGSGIDENDEADLTAFFLSEDPNTIIIQHYGGGSGLLKNEIYAALENSQNR